jgi:hypothetical protein
VFAVFLPFTSFAAVFTFSARGEVGDSPLATLAARIDQNLFDYSQGKTLQ